MLFRILLYREWDFISLRNISVGDEEGKSDRFEKGMKEAISFLKIDLVILKLLIFLCFIYHVSIAYFVFLHILLFSRGSWIVSVPTSV